MNNDDIKILEKKINIFNNQYDCYKLKNEINKLELKEIVNVNFFCRFLVKNFVGFW